ncbi:hypothetical protein [Clostridium oryzae]|uniref:Uncharacterized protein n=1 Tax=Clostridium oryzae TaxID=1450648 RepID=A0A1V4IVB6_9CLOT|nr:hypothetical protein [Clostridium oryzae]OPJ63998.1 hypothetical protein CLORY_08700 [Clostridium oryzae]
MNSVYQIYYVGISDFLDRIRSKSILIISLLMIYISYLFFPQNNTSIYYTLKYYLHGFFYRGVYNSVWLGWVATIAFISIVTLIGFYFVRNAINRERHFLIGEITASTPIKSWIFIFGKTFSSFLFLLLQMCVVILVTAIMQFVRGESYCFQPIKLITPFLILGVPACFITAVIAIIFETIPFLAKSLGNVIYFFVWSGILVVSMQGGAYSLTDVFGFSSAAQIILEQLKRNFKQFRNMNSFSLGTSGPLHNNVKTFMMNNVSVSGNVLFERCFWVLVGILLLILASMLFKRTYLAAGKRYTGIKSFMKEKTHNPQKGVVLSEIFEKRTYSNDFAIVKSEFKIMLSSANIWWYIAMFLCCICVFFTNGDSFYKVVIPAIWILPIFIWSRLGSIQMDFNMEEYLSTYKNYRSSQLLNSVAAGILFTIFINVTIIIKFVLLRNFEGAAYIFMGAIFVNALGIFIGNFAKSSTAFEITYIILWYVGITNGVSGLNFLGTTQQAASSHTPIVFLFIGIILTIASIIIKNRRMNNV